MRSKHLYILIIAVILSLAGPRFARAVTFQINDAVEFSKIINTNAVLTTNCTVNSWLEGPVWIPSGGYLLFCDQGSNILKKLVLPGTVSDFISPAANTLFNGNMLDSQERLISCQAGSAALRIVMVTNGVVTPLVTTCNGLKFYSPNDLAVKSDGTVWFTDPGYNGNTATPPQPGFQTGYYVYKFNMTNGNASCAAVITNGLVRPNGICFSPDETRLFVADSDTTTHNIHVYNVSASNTLSTGSIFCTIPNGVPDGIHCDIDGRVWSSGGDGAYIFATDGHQIGHIQFGLIANLCFGGSNYTTLFMTGQPVVTSIPVLVAGAPAAKTLRVSFNGNQPALQWPAPSTGFALQEASQLTGTSNWTNSVLSPTVSNGVNIVTPSTTDAARFYRLKLN